MRSWDSPADPSEAYSAARPEWYYLFLFQLLKYFPGSSEVIGAIVLPGVVMTILFLIPLIGRWEIGHQFNRAFVLLLLLGSVVLTGLALSEDYFVYVAKSLKLDESKYEKQLAASRDFIAAREAAEHDAHRINELINPSRMAHRGERAFRAPDDLEAGRGRSVAQRPENSRTATFQAALRKLPRLRRSGR